MWMILLTAAWLGLGCWSRAKLICGSHRDWGRDIYGWFGWVMIAAGPVGIVGGLWAW